MKLSKYGLVAQLYFFFNALLLRKGLLYTNILSPLFFYQQLKQRRNTYWKQFFGFLLIADCIHLFMGVHLTSFLVSNVYFCSCYFVVISFWYFFNNYEHLGRIYKQIVIVNFCLALVAVPFFFMEPHYQDWFWWVNREAMSKHEFPRLKLFTYEASYYSLIYVPIFYYYGFKLLFGQVQTNKMLTALVVFLPLLMSMSFGVLGATALMAVILSLVFWRKLLTYKRAMIISFSLLTLCVAGCVMLFTFYAESNVAKRLLSIIAGNDTSANGRTVDSFGIAWKLAEGKNIWFGIGLGQIKVEIENLVRSFYNYWGNYTRYDIPNAMGETLAIFGLTGVALRIFLEWFLFFRTKTYTNYYRLALFIFVFIYQFTGSFITNIVEYVIWILAFSQVFDQFNVNTSKT